METLTKKRPKVLLEIYNNKSSLELILDSLVCQHFDKVLVNYSYGKSYFEKIKYNYRAKINIQLIRSRALGQGNNIVNIVKRHEFIKKLLCINGDTLTNLDFRLFIKKVEAFDVAVLSSTKINPSRTLISDYKKTLIGFVKKTTIYFYRKRIINKYFLENYLGVMYVSCGAHQILRTIKTRGFLGIFGSKDLMEIFCQSGLNVRVVTEDLLTKYYTFNTPNEYMVIRNKLKTTSTSEPL